jgi:hypothetical protein
MPPRCSATPGRDAVTAVTLGGCDAVTAAFVVGEEEGGGVLSEPLLLMVDVWGGCPPKPAPADAEGLEAVGWPSTSMAAAVRTQGSTEAEAGKL